MIETALTEKQKKCIECCECCEYVEIPYTMFNLDTLEYFITRGTEFWLANNGAIQVRIHQPCIHLTDHGCNIYDNRPTTCRLYMCDVGDKSIKDTKAKHCAEGAEFIKNKILQFKENNKQSQGDES